MVNSRELAAKKLGRELLPHEIVFNLDPFNPNPDPSSLLIFRNQSDASKYNSNSNCKYVFHEGEDGLMVCNINPDSPFVKTCPVCGKEFIIKDIWNSNICCSKECESLYKRNDIRKLYLSLPNPYGSTYNGKPIPYEVVYAGLNIGRQIGPKETVWVIDGNHSNLEPTNLAVISVDDYHKLRTDTPNRYKLVPNSDGTYHLEMNENSKYYRICPYCGKKFMAPSCNKDKIYCSRSCAKRATSRKYDNNSYRALYMPDYPGVGKNGNILEHRYVAQEEILHRSLKPTEAIYHKNGILYDNSVENLMIFNSVADKNRFTQHHSSEIRVNEIEHVNTVDTLKQIVYIKGEGHDRVCPHCGKEFNVIDASNPRKFCSIVCRNNYYKSHPDEVDKSPY